MIRMELVKIIIQENVDQQVIVLRETDGERMFSIIIGIYEAAAIDRRIKKISTPRPLTHDLLNSVISGLGGTLSRVVVNDLQDGTFFAQLAIDLDGREVLIDSRPSDAIALAALDDTPIFVEESVLDEAGQSTV